MATMYVGGGLYLPTTGTASKPKTTSTPTGGTVTVAQRNAIASTKKPAATTVAKKPTTNTLSSMAGSSLGTTSTKKPTTVASPASTSSMGTSRSVTRSGNTAAQNAAVASLLSGAGTRSPTTNPLSTMAGRTLGINAALPQPPQLTKAQIGNRFTQSLAAGAKTGAAVPNPAGLTRDEADTLRSRFYTDFYSGKPVQQIALVPMTGRGIAAPTLTEKYGYLFGARNDDKPYVSAYDVAQHGSMSQAPDRLLPSNQYAGSLNGGVPFLDTAASNTAATIAGAGNAFFAPLAGLAYGAGDAFDGGEFVPDFLAGFARGEGDVNQFFDPAIALNRKLGRKAGDIVNVGSVAGVLPGVMGPTRAAAEAAAAASAAARASADLRAVAGIDAAITPTPTVQKPTFRQFMDGVYAGEQAAVPPPVSVGPRIPQGGISPTPAAVSPAEIARLESIVGNLGTRAQRAAIPSVPPSVARLPPDDLDALYRAVQEGMAAPDLPVATPAKPALSPREEYVRDFVETWGELPPANDAYFGPTSARTLYDPSTLSDPLSDGSLASVQSLSTPMEGIYPYPRGRTSSQYDDMLYSSVEDALGLGPTLARAEQLTPPAATGGNPATGRNAYTDVIDAVEAEKAALAARSGELFPDINPAATISDPVDVFGPQLPALPRQLINSYPTPAQWMDTVGPQRSAGTPFVNSFPDPMDVFGPQRPDFMFPDEAADIIRSGGPRVDATPRRFTPTAAGVRSIVGAGAGIPLALLPFADLPSGGGIDAVERGGVGPSAALDQIVKTPTGADITRADRARMRQGYGEASQLAAKAVAEKRDAEWSALPVAPAAPGVKFGDVKVRNGVPVKRNEFGAIVPVVNPNEPRLIPDPAFVPSIIPDNYPVDSDVPVVAVDPAGIDEVMPVDTSLTGPAVKAAEAAFMDPVEVEKRKAVTNRPEGGEFGSYTRFEPGPTASSGEQDEDTAAPAAGTKFTPGPGQFVGTDGYIYEQSSDGSFEQVGRVPGYTPAQLSEAANKGAFRDPNNIVVGSGKRTKSAPAESLVATKPSSKKRKKKDEDETDGGTGGTGTGGTGTGTYTPPTQAMIDALYAPYMRQYTGPGAGYVPGVNPEWRYFTPAFADGGLVDGRLVLGDGGPKEDKIPATIDGVEQAKLSNGEFVMTAAAVKNAGGGDIELGAKRLMDLNNMLSYGRPAERLKVQHVK